MSTRWLPIYSREEPINISRIAHLAAALNGRSIVRMDIGNAFIVLFGLLFVAFGFLNYYLTAGVYGGRNAQEAMGVVVDVVTYGRGTETAVRFTTAEGKEVVFRQVGRPPIYSVGQTLAVSYDPAHPQNATIGSLSSVRRSAIFTSAGFILFGLLVCFAGLGSAFGLWEWRPTARR